MKKPNYSLSLLGMIGLLILSSCSFSKQEQEHDKGEVVTLPDAPNYVKVMRLEREDFNREILSNGVISASKKADLYFEQPDVIERIYVKNGESVVGGQKLASLVRFKRENSLKQALDNLKKAKLELQDVLIGQGHQLEDSLSIPKSVMDLAKVRSGYDNSLIQYDLAVHNLEKTVLYAPFSGVVANLFCKEHNTPASGTPFCTVINSTALNVEFNILESELQQVNLNDRVTVMPVSLEGRKAEGRIQEINPLVDKNGMVRILAAIDQTNGLKLYEGMNIKVLILHLYPNQLTIPKEALVLRTNKEVVFTLRNDKAHWNYVTTGAENSSAYIILEGLTEGDSIIYEGNIDLAHETPVKFKK